MKTEIQKTTRPNGNTSQSEARRRNDGNHPNPAPRCCEAHSARNGCTASESVRDVRYVVSPPPLPTHAIPPPLPYASHNRVPTAPSNAGCDCSCCGSTQNVKRRAYLYAYSLIFVSFLRTSKAKPVCDNCRVRAGWPQNVVSLCFGWFGFGGIVFTIRALWRNLHGGIIAESFDEAISAAVSQGVDKAFEQLRSEKQPRRFNRPIVCLLTAAGLGLMVALACSQNRGGLDADDKSEGDSAKRHKAMHSFEGEAKRVAQSSFEEYWIKNGDSWFTYFKRIPALRCALIGLSFLSSPAFDFRSDHFNRLQPAPLDHHVALYFALKLDYRCPQQGFAPLRRGFLGGRFLGLA